MYDFHVHCALDNKVQWISYYNDLCQNLKEHQIDCIRDAGDPFGRTIRFRKMFEDAGIRLFSPGFGISREGFYGARFSKTFRTLDNLYQLIDEAKGLGADYIKLFQTGIMRKRTYGCTDTEPAALTQEELHKTVLFSKERGLSVSVHCNTEGEISKAISAGVRSIEHGYGITEDCLYRMKEKRCFWNPTIVPILKLSEECPGYAFTRYLQDQTQSLVSARMIKAPLLIGSDTSGSAISRDIQREYDIYASCGLTSQMIDESIREYLFLIGQSRI